MKKSTILDILNEFPAEFNLDDFLERLIVIEKLRNALLKPKPVKLFLTKK